MFNVKAILLPVLVAAGIPLPVAAQNVADTQPETSQRSNAAPRPSAGYPLPGGPGPSSPNYQGGRSSEPGPAAEQADQQAATVSGGPGAENAAVSSQEDPQYPARRGYGLGYPYDGMNRGAYRSRGYGYGRGRRGYGYGYPGYRGQGGSPYRQHRQYGNPPFHPGRPTVDDQPAAQE